MRAMENKQGGVMAAADHHLSLANVHNCQMSSDN